MAVVGTLTVDLVANTASFEGGMNRASTTSRRTSKEIQENFNRMDFREARGGLVLMDDLIGVHMPRHAAAFVSQIPGFAAAFNAMFPVVAVAVAAKAILEMTEHVKKHREELEKSKMEAADAALAYQRHAEALHISNMKLEDSIRIMTHKLPQNGVRIAMEEGRLAVSDLVAEFQKAIDKEAELLGKQEQGFFNKLFFGDQGANEIVKKSAEYRKQIDEIITNLRLAQSQGDTGGAAQYKADLAEQLQAYRQYLIDQSDAIDTEIQDRLDTFHEMIKHSSVPVPQDQVLKAEKSINQEYTQRKQDILELSILLQTFAKSQTDVANQNVLNVQKAEIAERHEAEAEEDRLDKMAIHFQMKEFEHAKLRKKRAQDEKNLKDEMEAGLIKISHSEDVLGQKQQAVTASQQQGAQKLIQLNAELSDQDALHNARMAVTMGRMTQQQAMERELGMLHKNKADALKQIDQELDAQIVKVKALGAATMNGLTGTDDQKAAYNRAVADYQHFEERKLQVTKQFNSQIQSAQLQLANNERAQWNRMFLEWGQLNQRMSQLARQTFENMTQSLSQFIVTGQGGWRNFAATAVTSLVQIELQHLIGMAIHETIEDKKKLSDAKSAARGAWSATADIPIIGPILAPIAAAAAFAGVMAFRHGGIVPEDAYAMVHQKEMVLPQHIANFVVEAASNSSGGGRGGPIHINPVFAPTVHAVDAAGVDRVLTKHHDVFKKHIEAVARLMNYA